MQLLISWFGIGSPRIRSRACGSQRLSRSLCLPPAMISGVSMSRLTLEYERLLAEGVHEEDARYVLPQGVASRLVVTMNARELRHFFELRCCLRAQFEIRALAWLMLAKAKAVAPLLFENAGPVCLQGMECPERSFACHLKTKGQRGESE